MPSLAGPTIKAALLAGFGLTLGLWLFAGYRLTERMTDLESQAKSINARYVRAQDLLSTVRARVLVGSVLVRDALLDPSPTAADGYRKRFEDTYRAADRALQRYVPVLDSPAERDGIAGLRREIDGFRQAMLAVLGTDRRQWPRQSRLLLQQRVVPRRELVIRISEQVQALNRGAFVAQSQATAAIYRQAQRDASRQLGVALAASLAIGLWAGLYAGRLETRLRRQRARDLQITNDLHRLSAKLVSAQEDERRMIARELHDEVGQALAAIRVELAFAQNADGAPSTVTARLDEVRAITEGALHTIRDLSHLLHPALLDELGLVAALESLARGFERRHGVTVKMAHHNMDQRLGSELETSIYRIVQEALNNVAKHAHATTCRLSLVRQPDTVLVNIQDNGAGFVWPSGNGLASSGLGLIGIRERAEQIGGTLRMETAPGRGTRLLVELPVRQHAGVSSGDGRTPTPDAVEDGMYGTLANLPR